MRPKEDLVLILERPDAALYLIDSPDLIWVPSPSSRKSNVTKLRERGVNRNTTNVSPFPSVGIEIFALLFGLYGWEVASRERTILDAKSQRSRV